MPAVYRLAAASEIQKGKACRYPDGNTRPGPIFLAFHIKFNTLLDYFTTFPSQTRYQLAQIGHIEKRSQEYIVKKALKVDKATIPPCIED
jgi:hypothetical protein